MGRINKVLTGIFFAAFLLILTTCDNSVDMLSGIELKVMKANDRYLEVVSVSPEQGFNDANPSSDIRIVFDKDLDPATIESNIEVAYKNMGDADFGPSVIDADWDVLYNSDTRAIKITPYPYLQPSRTVRIRLMEGLRTLNGERLQVEVSWAFTTNNDVLYTISYVDLDEERIQWANKSLQDNLGSNIIPMKLTISDIKPSGSLENYQYYVTSALMTSQAVLELEPSAWTTITDTKTIINTQSFASDGGPFNRYLWLYNPYTDKLVAEEPKVVRIYVDRTFPLFDLGSAVVTNKAIIFSPVVTDAGSGIAEYLWTGTGLNISDENTASVSVTASTQETFTLALKVTDIAGNDSTDTLSFTWDSVFPVAPAVPILDPADDTGSSSSDNITNKTSGLHLSGTAEANSTLNIKVGESIIATVFANGTGAWNTTVDCTSGTHAVTATATDTAGNEGPASDALNLIIDTTPPNSPVVSGTSPTTNRTPSWSWTSGGSGGAGTFRYNLDNTSWITTGATAYTPVSDLDLGNRTLYVQELDIAGNWSASGSRLLAVTPLAPTGVSATDNTSTAQVTVIWTGQSAGVSGYEVDRSTSSGGTYSLIGSSATTSFNDTTAASGTTYYYKVRAIGGGLSSTASSYDSGLRKLAAPTISASDNTSTTSIDVSWGAITGATSYTLQRAASSGGPYSTIASPSATSYSDTSASAGVLYYYQVRGNVGAYSSDYSAYNAGIRKLLAPGGISATDSTNTGYVTVSWNAVTGATSYYVDRSTSSAGTYSNVGSSASTSFNDTSATPGTVYYYKVRAYANSYYSDYSSNNAGVRKLAIPSGISATDNTITSYTTVSWSAVTGAASYYVDRSTTSTGTYSNIGTSATTSFNDTSATPGIAYYYKVRAYASGYYSDTSTYNEGIRRVAAPTNVSATDGTVTTGVTITWTAPTGGSNYYVYRATSSTGTYGYVGATTSTSYTDTGVTSTSTSYYYKITPYGAGSYVGDQSSYNDGYRGLVAPTGVNATDGTGNGSGSNYVRISWAAVTGAEGYYVYRADSTRGPFTYIGSSTSNLYLDYAAPYGTVYYFKVRAYDVSATYLGDWSSYNSGWRWEITSGLTGYWPLDNAYPWTDYGTANGLSDNFTKATVGSPINSAYGMVGQSVQVTGDDMKTSLGHTFMSSDRKKMSVAFWVYRRADYVSTNYFIRCTDFGIFQSNTSSIGLATWIGGGSTNSASYPIPINTWTHIVATYDGTYIRLYTNGVLRATTTHAGTISSSYTSYLTLGGYTSPSWNGNIDDLRIYNRVLTATEITGLYGWR